NPFVHWYTDNIVGAAEYFAAKTEEERAPLEKKVGIRVKKPRMIEVELIHPHSEFLEYLAMPSMAIIHPSLYEPGPQWKDVKKMIVSGPFVPVEWEIKKY